LFIITQTLSTATDTSAAWWSADAGTHRELAHWLRASPPNAGFRIVLDLPGDRTNSPNSEPIQIKLCSEFRERVEPRRWRTSEAGSASPNPPSRADDASSGPMSDRLSGQPRSTHIWAGNAKKAWSAGGRNEQCSKLGIYSGCRESHSARPHNRIRCGYHGRDAGRRDGAGGRDRHLVRPRCRYGMGSVAPVRPAARYISIEVGRSLTVWRGARPPGKTGLRPAKCRPVPGLLSPRIRGVNAPLTEVPTAKVRAVLQLLPDAVRPDDTEHGRGADIKPPGVIAPRGCDGGRRRGSSSPAAPPVCWRGREQICGSLLSLHNPGRAGRGRRIGRACGRARS